jgi:hypothetical protein
MADKPSDPDLKPFPKEGRPVVFMFQPTHYKVIPPDKLREWQTSLAERVGLKGFRIDEKMMQDAATYSWTSPNDIGDIDYME